MQEPDTMNTVNADGKAFNGNTNAVALASACCVVLGLVLIGALVA